MKRLTALFLAVVIAVLVFPFGVFAASGEYYKAVDSIENNATYIMSAQIYGKSDVNDENTTQLSILNVPEIGSNYTVSTDNHHVNRNLTKVGDCVAAPAGSTSSFEITAVESGHTDSDNNVGYYLKQGESFLMLYQACDNIYKAYDNPYTYGSFKCTHYTFITSPILKFGTTHQVWFWDSAKKAFYTNYSSDTSSIGTYYSAQSTGSADYEGYYINHSQYNSVRVLWDYTISEDASYSYAKFYLMGRYNSSTQRYFESMLSSIPDDFKDKDVLSQLCYSNQYGFGGTALSVQNDYPTPKDSSYGGVMGMQLASLTMYKKIPEPTATATVNICADGAKTTARDGDTVVLRNAALSQSFSSVVTNGTASFSDVALGTYSILLLKNGTYTDIGLTLDVTFSESNIKNVPVYRVTQSCTDVPAGKSPETTVSGLYFPNEYVTLNTSNIIYNDNNSAVSIFSGWSYPSDLTVSGGKLLMPWKNVTVNADYDYYEAVISQLTDSEYVPVAYLQSPGVLEGYTSSPDNYFKLSLKRGVVNESPTKNITVSKPYPSHYSLICVDNPSSSTFTPGDVLKFSAYTGLTGNIYDYWVFYIDIAEGVELTKYTAVTTDVFPIGTQFDVNYLPGSLGTGAARTEKKNATVTKTLSGALFTRTGYIQTGWTDEDGGEQLYSLGGSYNTDAAVTLYPVWAKDPDYVFSVTGNIVLSSGDSSLDVLVELWENGTATPAYSANADSGTYTLSNVVPGTYILKVSKENHITEEYTVTVGSENITKEVRLWQCGDINRDSVPDALDCMLCEQALSGQAAPAASEFKYYDINASGACDTADYQLTVNKALNRI